MFVTLTSKVSTLRRRSFANKAILRHYPLANQRLLRSDVDNQIFIVTKPRSQGLCGGVIQNGGQLPLRKDPGNEEGPSILFTIGWFCCRTLPLMKLKSFRIPVQFSFNNITVMSKLKVCHSSKMCNKYHMHIAYDNKTKMM